MYSFVLPIYFWLDLEERLTKLYIRSKKEGNDGFSFTHKNPHGV